MFGFGLLSVGQEVISREIWRHELAHSFLRYPPAIGRDGTIYLTDIRYQTDLGHLHAINPDGTKKWVFRVDQKFHELGPVSIGSDGTIYVGAGYDSSKCLYAINPDGSEKWEVKMHGDVLFSPAIGPDGTIYVNDPLNWDVLALNPDGTKKWTFQANGPLFDGLAIGSDSTIYVGSSGGEAGLFAINPNGSQKWVFNLEYNGGSPAIGSDGTIYVGAGEESKSLFAINPDGSEQWRFRTDLFILNDHAPVIGSDGTIYITTFDKLYAINRDGSKKWTLLEEKKDTSNVFFSMPAIGNDGTIYVQNCRGNFYAIDHRNGSKKWTFKNNIYRPFPPTIGRNGTLYVGYKWDEGFNFIESGIIALKSSSTGPAYSSWPMYGQNLQRTGRVKNPIIGLQPESQKVILGNHVELKIRVAAGAKPFSYQWFKDGVIIPGAISPTLDLGLVTITNSGEYHVVVSNKFGSVESETANLKVSKVVESNWKFKIISDGSDFFSSPALGSDGTIYVGSRDRNIYAINPDGSKKWKFKTGNGVYSSPAIGSDGIIYVGTYNLYAINPDGSKKWEFKTGSDFFSSPALGSDGTIYVGSINGKIYAINPDGSNKWEFKTGDRVLSSPALGSDGTIYVGSYDDHLYAINLDGSKKWEFRTNGWIFSSPTLGSDGTIYVGSWDNQLYAINPDGSNKWEFRTGSKILSSPALGGDGTIYVGSSDGNIYVIQTSTTGVLKSSWPMFRQNAQHTGRLDTKPPTIQINQAKQNPNLITISFKDLSGKTYTLQSSSDLLNWQSLDNDISKTDEVGITIEPSEEKIFYRLKLNED